MTSCNDGRAEWFLGGTFPHSRKPSGIGESGLRHRVVQAVQSGYSPMDQPDAAPDRCCISVCLIRYELD